MMMMRCWFVVAAAAAADDGRDGKIGGFDGSNSRCWWSGRNVLMKANAAGLVFHCSDRQHLSHLEAEISSRSNKKVRTF